MLSFISRVVRGAHTYIRSTSDPRVCTRPQIRVAKPPRPTIDVSIRSKDIKHNTGSRSVVARCDGVAITDEVLLSLVIVFSLGERVGGTTQRVSSSGTSQTMVVVILWCTMRTKVDRGDELERDDVDHHAPRPRTREECVVRTNTRFLRHVRFAASVSDSIPSCFIWPGPARHNPGSKRRRLLDNLSHLVLHDLARQNGTIYGPRISSSWESPHCNGGTLVTSGTRAWEDAWLNGSA